MIEHIEINLLPAEYRVHSRRDLVLEKAVLIPAITGVVVFLVLTIWTVTLQATMAHHRIEIAKIETDIANNQHILEEINALKGQKAEVEKKIHALKLIDVNREKWIRLLEVFGGKIPESTWLDNMTESGDSSGAVVTLEGKTYSFPEVASFMANLEENEYVKGVLLKSIDQIDARQGIFRFTLICTLNPDAKLKRAPAEGGTP